MKRIGLLFVGALLTAALPVFATGTNEEAEGAGGEDVVEIRFLNYQDSFDPEKDPTRARIEEELGVRIIPEMGNDDDKVNLIVSSGQEYDAIMGSNRNLLANFISNEAIQDLTDEVEAHGPNLQRHIGDALWSMVSSDGRTYALPTEVEPIIDWGIMIRQDWLDALGLDHPSTPEEFHDVLAAFKEEDPGNVGSENVIPLVVPGMNNTSLHFNGLSQAFGIGSAPADFVVEDGQLVSGLELSGTQEYLAYLNRLYTEGLLDADFPATNSQAMDRKVGSGVVGAFYTMPWWTSGVKTLENEVPGAEVVYLDPLVDDSGERRIRRNAGLKFFLIVPHSSNKAAEVVKFANDFLSPENYTSLVVGEEGVHHEIDTEGNYQPILPAFDELNKGRWFFPVNVGELYLPLFAARAHKEPTMGAMFDDLQEKQPYAYDRVTDYAPILPAVQEYGQALTSYAEENLMKMVIDKDELADFDAFVAEWRRRGGTDVTDAYNEWYRNR